MTPKSDSVFQVSLTEIAFTLVLLLLLLLGARLTDVETRLDTKSEELQQSLLLIEKQKAELAMVQKINNRYGGVCTTLPDDPLDNMMPCEKCVAAAGKMTRDEAKKSIAFGKQLFEQWKAHSQDKKSFAEFKRKMEEAATKLAKGHTLVTNQEIQDHLDKAQVSIEEADRVKKANDTLLQQNAYLQRYKGAGAPPCWITAETYKPQFLFNVLIKNDSLYEVEPGWPQERILEALAVPGVRDMVEKRNLSRSEFNHYSSLILDYSKKMEPAACRFFVRMRSEIPDRVTADKARRNLENYFYKLELN